jgi:hypothetical protein
MRQYMSYQTRVKGMDEETASFMYRAELLLEKGYLTLAKKYLQEVYARKYDCDDAYRLETMIDEMIETGPTPPSTSFTKAEMHVHWTGDAYDTREAFKQARFQLEKTGHGNSLLKLLSNETRHSLHTALFEVTLIPGGARY